MTSLIQPTFLDLSAARAKDSFHGIQMLGNQILGHRLPDGSYSTILLNPLAMEDTRSKTHLLHVEAIGKGYKKRRVSKDIFYQGSKRWGKYIEDVDIQENSPYYVHGIEPDDIIFLKTPFFKENGCWFYVSDQEMKNDVFCSWISGFHPEDKRRDRIRHTDETFMDAIMFRLYIVCASEAIGKIELEEGEEKDRLPYRIFRGDMMSAM